MNEREASVRRSFSVLLRGHGRVTGSATYRLPPPLSPLLRLDDILGQRLSLRFRRRGRRAHRTGPVRGRLSLGYHQIRGVLMVNLRDADIDHRDHRRPGPAWACRARPDRAEAYGPGPPVGAPIAGGRGDRAREFGMVMETGSSD